MDETIDVGVPVQININYVKENGNDCTLVCNGKFSGGIWWSKPHDDMPLESFKVMLAAFKEPIEINLSSEQTVIQETTK